MSITVILPLLLFYMYLLLSIWSCVKEREHFDVFSGTSGFFYFNKHWLSLAFFPRQSQRLDRETLALAEQNAVMANTALAFNRQSDKQKAGLCNTKVITLQREVHEVLPGFTKDMVIAVHISPSPATPSYYMSSAPLLLQLVIV